MVRVVLIILIAMVPLPAAISVQLSPNLGSPQPLGTVITFTANVSDTQPGAHDYQFSTQTPGQASTVVIDFNYPNQFLWAPSFEEGTYQISVMARNTTNLTTATASLAYTVKSLLTAQGLANVTRTAHPLVALFSAPACGNGNSMHIVFSQQGTSTSQATNLVPCHWPTTMNFYIAGMYPSSTYTMHYELLNAQGGVVREGTARSFTTGAVSSSVYIPPLTVVTPASPPTSLTNPILFQDFLPGSIPSPVPAATDLSGNVLWYFPVPVSFVGRTEPGGNIFLLPATRKQDSHYNLIGEADLAGNILFESNASRISEQLAALGRRPINTFTHEVRRLANGNVVVMGADEMLSTTAQGGTEQNPVDILGAQVIVLDQNLRVVWAWDAYDWLDINRAAVLGEVCQNGHEGMVGCPVFHLASQANDWLHANTIFETSDGNLIVSLRNQDWIVKIDYANGSGDGHVLWTIGAGGNFTMNSTDPCPWFSHQHDTNFQAQGMTVLAIYDNGNTRLAKCDPNAHSRGYVLNVNTVTMTVTPTLLADLGVYSTALGSAELLPNGNYSFDSGWIVPGSTSRTTEITPSLGTAFLIEAPGITYRSFRMQDMYTPGE